MITTLEIIAPLFIIIFASALYQRWRIFDDAWINILNAYALQIGLPILLFSSLSQSELSWTDDWLIVILNSIFMLTGYLLVHLLSNWFQWNDSLKKTLFITLTFGNVAYLGFPLLTEVYGEDVRSEISLIVAVYFFWIFSIGLTYLEQHQGNTDITASEIAKALLFNPLLLGVTSGLLLNTAGATTPDMLQQSIDLVSASVTPIVLIVIGLFIGSTAIGNLRDWLPALVFSVVTLLILPGIIYLTQQLFYANHDAFRLTIMQAAMPLAITPFALADKYGLQREFIARSIVLSTVLSILTLPLWIEIL